MGRPRKPDHVQGVSSQDGRWYVRYIEGGRDKKQFCASEKAAIKEAQKMAKKFGQPVEDLNSFDNKTQDDSEEPHAPPPQIPNIVDGLIDLMNQTLSDVITGACDYRRAPAICSMIKTQLRLIKEKPQDDVSEIEQLSDADALRLCQKLIIKHIPPEQIREHINFLEEKLKEMAKPMANH